MRLRSSRLSEVIAIAPGKTGSKLRKLTPGTVANQVAALRFLSVKTLKRHQFRDFLPYPRDRRRLPTVLSREEVSRLINAAGTLFRRTLLMTLRGTGMRRAELAHLTVSDIDSQRMIIRVVDPSVCSLPIDTLSHDFPHALLQALATLSTISLQPFQFVGALPALTWDSLFTSGSIQIRDEAMQIGQD